MTRLLNVLFLCTGNSARSILAEALLNREGADRFRAFSAGSFPRGEVHPMALQVLGERGISTTGLRSKSWDEFSGPEAPELDFIFTVCDNAAGEVCPIWPGRPVAAHWGLPDPAAVEGPSQHAAFVAAFEALDRRIASFLSLPLDDLDPKAVLERLRHIGEEAEPPVADAASD